MVGGVSWGYVGLSWGYVAPSWGQCGPILGLCWPILGLSWPILGLCWPILGLCWPSLEAMLAHLGAMLAQLEPYVGPCWPILRPKIRKAAKSGKRTKHCKTRDILAYQVGRRQGVPPLSPTERREPPYGNATARGPLAGLSAYARQPARGPTMLAHLVAICWPMLAYVGLSCGQRGPILWLWWPMFPACWPMLSQKIRKIGTAKKRCKTQDILMVGGLSWGYVGPAWGYVGLS